jgi:hypothetical protein
VTYTNQQIRGAILATANLFEQRPELWKFSRIDVPECGSPGCAIGYITHFLGMRDIFGFRKTTELLVADADLDGMPGSVFYGRTGLSSYVEPQKVPGILRAYADRYFPAAKAEKADQLDPAYLAFKRAFTNAVEAA